MLRDRVYKTVTHTSFTTSYSTLFVTRVVTVTHTTTFTVIAVAVTTQSIVNTATSVIFLTSTMTTSIAAGAKRDVAWLVPTATPTTTPSLDSQLTPTVVAAAQPSRVTLGVDKGFDALAERLENRGVIVERTITKTVSTTISSTIRLFTTITRTSSSTQLVTKFHTSTLISTKFTNVQTTVTVTNTLVAVVTIHGESTVTVTRPPESYSGTSSAPQPAGPTSPAPSTSGDDEGLPLAARVGIGVGVGLIGLLGLLGLAIYTCRRGLGSNMGHSNNSSKLGVASAISDSSYLAGVEPANPLAAVEPLLHRADNGNTGYPPIQQPQIGPFRPVPPPAITGYPAAPGTPGVGRHPADYNSRHVPNNSYGSAAPLVEPSSPSSYRTGNGAWSPPPLNEMSSHNQYRGGGRGSAVGTGGEGACSWWSGFSCRCGVRHDICGRCCCICRRFSERSCVEGAWRSIWWPP